MELELTVEFASGFQSCVKLALPLNDADEWWVEITERQNQYDLFDTPIAIYLGPAWRTNINGGNRISLDEAWIDAVEEFAQSSSL